MSNGNSFGNGASVYLGLDPGSDPRARTMAWIFRRQIARVP